MSKSTIIKSSKKRGKFITLEGMDGAGKSTHIPNIIAALKARGIEVVATREPGGTRLGEALRALLLHDAMHAETETLLMFAARREHIARIIEPDLNAAPMYCQIALPTLLMLIKVVPKVLLQLKLNS